MSDFLTDRDCAILDGECNCPRINGDKFPFCQKYGTLKALSIKNNCISCGKGPALCTCYGADVAS